MNRQISFFTSIKPLQKVDIRLWNDTEKSTMAYSIVKSPFGNMLIASVQQHICSIDFLAETDCAEAELQRKFPTATLHKADVPWHNRIALLLEGEHSPEPISVIVQATPFQLAVWNIVKEIPYGETVTYNVIASYLGKPNAARAVGTAVGKNPVAYLIPCHRVVQQGGGLGGYRWGIECKQALLAWERSKLAGE